MAVVARSLTKMLEEIRAGIPQFKTARQKLAFAFEVWFIRPFEMVLASPDASDLFERSCELACETLIRANADFDAIVADVLRPLVREQSRVKLPAGRIAEILCGATHGFKKTASDGAELRRMLGDHLTLVLAGLGEEK